MNFIRSLILRLRYESTHNTTTFKKNILNALPFWLGALITGLVAVIYARLFAWAESGTVYVYHHASWMFFFITPLTFTLAWWLVNKYAPFARGSGIPQVSAAIELSTPKHNHLVNHLLSIRVIFIKIISSMIMVFGGGVTGREGPTIQIASSIYKKINDLLPSWYPKISRRNMIITGAAAGLASAFNTPLGGIVFTIEELTKTHFSYFKSALLTGVIVAGLTALSISGPYLYLGYPVLTNISNSAIWIILIVSVTGGLTGMGMTRSILFILKKKELIQKNYLRVIYVIVCGLIIAALAYFIDVRTFGSGKEIMVTTLFSDHKHVEWYLPLIRIVGPIITFTTGASGGVFAPSLSAGASIGSLISGWFALSGTDTNLVILCGMAAVLTGVTRSPFTSSILVLEMTNSHNIIFYVLLSALASNLVSNLTGKKSFYDHMKEVHIHNVKLAPINQ